MLVTYRVSKSSQFKSRDLEDSFIVYYLNYFMSVGLYCRVQWTNQSKDINFCILEDTDFNNNGDQNKNLLHFFATSLQKFGELSARNP